MSLYDKLCWAETLAGAYAQAKANRGAAGVDGIRFEDIEGYGMDRWLEELRQELLEETYRPQAVRRVLIPKPGGGERPLGIPTIRDRVVQAAAVLVLEPIFEADLEENAYAYRRDRSAHDALWEVQKRLFNGRVHVVDADLSKYLDTSSYCTSICYGAVKESRHRLRKLDSQAFSASLIDVNGVKLAALYTLQDSLAANAKGECGFEHRDVASGCLVYKTGAQLIGDADSPRGAGRELLAGDEAVIQPAMHRGWCDAKNFGSAIDSDVLSTWLLLGRFEARNLPVGAQAADAVSGEAHACCGGLALAIENAGDDGVGVVHGQAAHELNDILIGTNRRRVRARQMHVELGEQSAAPAQRQVRLFLFAFDFDEDLLD